VLDVLAAEEEAVAGVVEVLEEWAMEPGWVEVGWVEAEWAEWSKNYLH